MAALYIPATSTPHSLITVTSLILSGSWEHPQAEPPQQPQSSALPVKSQGGLQFAVGDRWGDVQNDVLKLEQRKK